MSMFNIMYGIFMVSFFGTLLFPFVPDSDEFKWWTLPQKIIYVTLLISTIISTILVVILGTR
jgi:hypothetical protein